MQTLGGFTAPIGRLALSANGVRVATTEGGMGLTLWEAETGRKLITLADRPVPVTGTSLQSRWPAARGGIGALRPEITGMGYRNRSRSPARSQMLRGRWLIAPTAGSSLPVALLPQEATVWDLATGRLAFILRGHAEAITALAFAPDGRRIVSAGQDRTIKLWDGDTGREVLTLPCRWAPPLASPSSPDGNRLYAASANGTVRVWDATPLPQSSDLHD